MATARASIQLLRGSLRQLVPPPTSKLTEVSSPFSHITIGDYPMRSLTRHEVGSPVFSNWFPAVKTPNSEDTLFLSNPNGWYGLAKADEAPIGGIAAFPKSQHTAWLGYYYIIEELRGKGHAEALLNEVISDQEEQGVEKFSLQCFGTLERLYSRYGFHTTHQDVIHNTQLSEPYKDHLSYDIPKLSFSSTRFKQLVNYDSSVQQALDRSVFLYYWLSKPNTSTLVALDSKSNEPVGYSVVHHDFYFESAELGNHHHRIGPLYADSPEVAKQLLDTSLSVASAPKKLQAKQHTTSVFLDSSGSNATASSLLTQIGMFKPIASLSNMSRGNDKLSSYDTQRVFAPADYGMGA